MRVTVSCYVPYRMTWGLNDKMHSKEPCNMQLVLKMYVCGMVLTIGIMPLKMLLPAGRQVPRSDSLADSHPKVGKNRVEAIMRKKSPQI